MFHTAANFIKSWKKLFARSNEIASIDAELAITEIKIFLSVFDQYLVIIINKYRKQNISPSLKMISFH